MLDERYVRESEKDRCLEWLRFARSQGETDMRQVIHWIEMDRWPPDEEEG